MATHCGYTRKLAITAAANAATPLAYELVLGDARIGLNALLGQEIAVVATGKIACVACARPLKKSFQQGYCYPCSQKLAAADICQVRPELCHFAAGTCREPAWAQQNCFISHTLYLAASSAVKVGITRTRHQRQRWYDQGARQALALAYASDRKTVGTLEVALKAHLSDRTNWRAMLRGEAATVDLAALATELLPHLPADVLWQPAGAAVETFTYPVQAYPTKVVSHNLDKDPHCAGVLVGMHGQYLIFGHAVLNVRKYSGYEFVLTTP